MDTGSEGFTQDQIESEIDFRRAQGIEIRWGEDGFDEFGEEIRFGPGNGHPPEFEEGLSQAG
ncbi:MAG: hypothetical protein LR011_02470, partial [Verrucomicrobia bacterium]|nr:hypothetical protein [Verrucomicrobiota bacterium]